MLARSPKIFVESNRFCPRSFFCFSSVFHLTLVYFRSVLVKLGQTWARRWGKTTPKPHPCAHCTSQGVFVNFCLMHVPWETDWKESIWRHPSWGLVDPFRYSMKRAIKCPLQTSFGGLRKWDSSGLCPFPLRRMTGREQRGGESYHKWGGPKPFLGRGFMVCLFSLPLRVFLWVLQFWAERQSIAQKGVRAIDSRKTAARNG